MYVALALGGIKQTASETGQENFKALSFTTHSKPVAANVVTVKRAFGFIYEGGKFILLIWRC